jgi:hypothetical protein
MSPLKDCLRLEISDILYKEKMRESMGVTSQPYLYPSRTKYICQQRARVRS